MSKILHNKCAQLTVNASISVIWALFLTLNWSYHIEKVSKKNQTRYVWTNKKWVTFFLLIRKLCKTKPSCLEKFTRLAKNLHLMTNLNSVTTKSLCGLKVVPKFYVSCLKVVMVVFQSCLKVVTVVFQSCLKVVTVVSQRCLKVIMVVSQSCLKVM